MTLLLRSLRLATPLVACSAVFCAEGVAAEAPDPALDQANKALARLTVEEKVSLCHGDGTFSINAIPRVGLKQRFWMSDGPNNVRHDMTDADFAALKPDSDPSEQSTSLPRSSVLGMTWNRDLAREYGRVLGQEARARGKDMMLGPGVNIVRTPLCGRNLEYIGEDPFLAGQIAVPEIEGVQESDVAACVKHYALNNQEWNRGAVDVEVDDRTLHEIYLPAFEAAVKEGRVLAAMGAYNRVRGDFCCASDLLLNQILKKSWGFPGFVVSDWGAVHDTLDSARGGLDVEMNAGNAIKFFKEPLLQAVQGGQVPMAALDDKARRVLYVMAKLHLLDGAPRAAGSLNTPEHQAVARRVAEEGIVLLKNDRHVLPLDPDKVRSVLVIGANAVEPNCRGGGSSGGNPPYEVTPLMGLQKLLGPSVRIESEPLGSTFGTMDLAYAGPAPGGSGWKAQYYRAPDCSGPAADTGSIKGTKFEWREPQKEIGDDYAAQVSATVASAGNGKFKLRVGHDGGVRVRVNGEVVAEDWADGPFRVTEAAFDAPAAPFAFALEYRHKGDERSRLFLNWHTPKSRPEPDLNALAEKARTFDCVLFFTGDHESRDETGEGEGRDRPGIDLPFGTTEAIAAVLAGNPNTVVLNMSGAPVAMPWIDQAPTLLHYSFSGMESGNALARVLFGQVDPSGKLTVTFPRKIGDSPAHALHNYNDQKVTYAEGVLVGYRWFDAKRIEPLFPFGYGLSYTTFELSDLKLSAPSLHGGDALTVTVDVANTGAREGAEVVQLYVGDPSATVARPPDELKGFDKVDLKPGERKTVSFTLPGRAFSYWDERTGGWKIDPGEFPIRVGDSSRHLPLSQNVTVAE